MVLVGLVPSRRRSECLRHEPQHRPRRGKGKKHEHGDKTSCTETTPEQPKQLHRNDSGAAVTEVSLWRGGGSGKHRRGDVVRGIWEGEEPLRAMGALAV